MATMYYILKTQSSAPKTGTYKARSILWISQCINFLLQSLPSLDPCGVLLSRSSNPLTMLPYSNPETTAHPSPTQASCEKLPDRFPLSGISVLIAGGGVAGLLAALECWRKGHNVRIVERSPSRLLSGIIKNNPKKYITVFS